MKRFSPSSLARDEKYRSIFEYSAVSLWEEDISKLRSRLNDLKTGGSFNLRAHLAAHPEFVQEAVQLIDVTDVNEVSLRLFEADRKEQLLGPLNIVLGAVSRTALSETILAIDEGRSDIEVESSALTLKGKKLSLVVKSHVPQADAAYPHMLVSLIDVTARKQAEKRERTNAIVLRSIIESFPDTIFVKDATLRMILCNSALSHSVGKEPQDTYGKTDIENGWSADFVKGNSEKGIVGWERDDLAVLSGKTIQVDEEPADFDSGVRYFHTTKLPLRDEDDTIIGLVGIGRDVTDQKKAETELRRAKEFAENLINMANVMVLGLDLDGRVTIFNKAAEDITGYRRAEVMNRAFSETFVPKERYPQAWGILEKIVFDGPGVVEHPIFTRSGEERYLTWQINLIRESGNITGILSFGVDITDRRRMEQELAWERSLFDMMMENLPDHIYFKDLESRFIRISRSHARILGLKDPAEAVGKTDADFYGADHALKALEDEQTVLRTGMPLLSIEERETYPDQPDTWAITTKMPFRNAAGGLVGTFGISHDITARKQLEARNQELAALVDSSSDAIVGIDLDGRITSWNRGAERLYGHSVEEIIGAPISILVPPDRQEETRTQGERLRRGEAISHFETIRLRKDGSKVNISLSLSPIRDEEGRIAGTAAVGGDITEQKAIQAQLNRAQRLEGLATLAGGVAHKFNNINTVIGSYLSLMRSEPGLPARLVTFAEAASAGIQKAVDITDRLLTLTEPAGALSRNVRLDVLARALLHEHQERIEKERVRLMINLDEAPPVQADESRLKFVLSSIIGNALDSLLDRPLRMVNVRTGRTGDSAYFEVEDSGCGISKEDLARIFSPFFSGKGEWAPPGSPQAKLKGTGLSLAISSTMVSEYDGRIEVQSAKGTGSTFRVVMPCAT